MNIEDLVAQLPKSEYRENKIGPMKQADWEATGSPYVWNFAEEAHGVTVLIDSGYGKLATFYKGKFQQLGDRNYVDPDSRFVVLDTEYYGTSKFIWT